MNVPGLVHWEWNFGTSNPVETAAGIAEIARLTEIERQLTECNAERKEDRDKYELARTDLRKAYEEQACKIKVELHLELFVYLG